MKKLPARKMTNVITSEAAEVTAITEEIVECQSQNNISFCSHLRRRRQKYK